MSGMPGPDTVDHWTWTRRQFGVGADTAKMADDAKCGRILSLGDGVPGSTCQGISITRHCGKRTCYGPTRQHRPCNDGTIMMMRLRGRMVWLEVLLLLGLTAGLVPAEEWEKVLIPARSDLPLANPITTTEIPPPPLSLLKDRPVNPAYAPGLPGLPQGKVSLDDFGNKKPKYDGVIIRQSRVQDGQVMIPAGGLVYLEETWRGEVALVGERIAYLGKEPIYIDYDMSIVVQRNVTIPSGES